MSNAIASLEESSAADLSRILYAFLAENERRSGSLRTVQSYSRMLNDFFGRSGKTPDKIEGGISKLHPHRLRHSFATRFLTEGLGDTFQLQQLLGHTSLEMVRRYFSLASVERVILDRRPSSPLDSVEGSPKSLTAGQGLLLEVLRPFGLFRQQCAEGVGAEQRLRFGVERNRS